MTVKTEKVVHKPRYSDAIQVNADNIDDIASWCQGAVHNVEVSTKGYEGGRYVKVKVHNPIEDRHTRAYYGDWVLFSGRAFRVYSNKAFMSTFVMMKDEQKKDAEEKMLLLILEKLDQLLLREKG